MIRHIKFEVTPATALWRVQCVAALVALVLVVILPLTTMVKAVLLSALGLILLVQHQRNAAQAVVSGLYIDIAQREIRVSGAGDEPVACRGEYFSGWLIVFGYKKDNRWYRLPIFRNMTSEKDFSRLLVLARSASAA